MEAARPHKQRSKGTSWQVFRSGSSRSGSSLPLLPLFLLRLLFLLSLLCLLFRLLLHPVAPLYSKLVAGISVRDPPRSMPSVIGACEEYGNPQKRKRGFGSVGNRKPAFGGPFDTPGKKGWLKANHLDQLIRLFFMVGIRELRRMLREAPAHPGVAAGHRVREGARGRASRRLPNCQRPALWADEQAETMFGYVRDELIALRAASNRATALFTAARNLFQPSAQTFLPAGNPPGINTRWPRWAPITPCTAARMLQISSPPVSGPVPS